MQIEQELSYRKQIQYSTVTLKFRRLGSVVTTAVSLAISEIFSVKPGFEICVIENGAVR